MSKIEHITTEAAVQTYEHTREIFDALLEEIRALSKKKPDLELTVGKVNNLNRVLKELMTILKEEPEEKFLGELNDQSLPQASDALILMRTFEIALDAFCDRYGSEYGWITPELVAELEAAGIQIDGDDGEDDEDEDQVSDKGDDDHVEGAENEGWEEDPNDKWPEEDMDNRKQIQFARTRSKR